MKLQNIITENVPPTGDKQIRMNLYLRKKKKLEEIKKNESWKDFS